MQAATCKHHSSLAILKRELVLLRYTFLIVIIVEQFLSLEVQVAACTIRSKKIVQKY